MDIQKAQIHTLEIEDHYLYIVSNHRLTIFLAKYVAIIMLNYSNTSIY